MIASPQSQLQVPDLTNQEVKELERRIGLLLTRITLLTPFFSNLLYQLEIRISKTPNEFSPEVGAAITPKGVVYFYPPIITESNEQILTTLIHEVSHPAFLCWIRMGNRKKIVTDKHTGSKTALWNIAHDLAINQIAEDIYQKNPRSHYMVSPKDDPHFCYDPQYDGWTAEAIYDDLEKKIPEIPPQWYQICGDTGDPNQVQPKDEKESQKVKWQRAVINAYEYAKGQGEDVPIQIEKYVQELTQPVLHWTERLRRFLGEFGRPDNWTYARPSRRSQALGITLPSMRDSGNPHITVILDDSGSMHGRQCRLLTECINIANELDQPIRVIVCDTQIRLDKSPVTNANQIVFEGGGGSNFTPAFQQLAQEQFEGVVVAATDGHIQVPKMMPRGIQACFWAIWDNASDTDPTEGLWGETVLIKE